MVAPSNAVGYRWSCPECDSTLRHTVNITITLTPMEMHTYDMELEWSEGSQSSESSENGSIISLVDSGTQTDYHAVNGRAERHAGRQTDTTDDKDPGNPPDTTPQPGKSSAPSN